MPLTHTTQQSPTWTEFFGHFRVAHRAVQEYFRLFIRLGAQLEYPIPGSGPNGGIGRADIVHGNEVWEVKHKSLGAVKAANAALDRYIRASSKGNQVRGRPSIPNLQRGAIIPTFMVPFDRGHLQVESPQSGVLLYQFVLMGPQPITVPAPAPARVPAPSPQPVPSSSPSTGLIDGLIVGGAVLGLGICFFAGPCSVATAGGGLVGGTALWLTS